MPYETASSSCLRVIVLAAQRAGVTDPLALKHGVSHKCLIPLRGKPLISHVLTTIAHHPDVADIVVSVEPDVFDRIEDIVGMIETPHAPVCCVQSRDNLADSVVSAAQDHPGPMIITTADNALLLGSSIDAMRAALLSGHDVALAMARRESVLAAHPDGQRRFYRFTDDEYSNCNLYGLAGPQALAATEIFRGGGQFAKKASRIVQAFGLVNLLLIRFRLISLEGGLRRISKRIGLKAVPVILTDGSQAIDVDNDRTYRVVSELLDRQSRELKHPEELTG